MWNKFIEHFTISFSPFTKLRNMIVFFFFYFEEPWLLWHCKFSEFIWGHSYILRMIEVQIYMEAEELTKWC